MNCPKVALFCKSACCKVKQKSNNIFIETLVIRLIKLTSLSCNNMLHRYCNRLISVSYRLAHDYTYLSKESSAA